MSVKFLHVRLLTKEGTPLPKGGATVAYRLNDDKLYEVSFSLCSTKDHYCKKIGRDVSMGRLLTKTHFSYIEADTKQELFDSIKEELDTYFPKGTLI